MYNKVQECKLKRFFSDPLCYAILFHMRLSWLYFFFIGVGIYVNMAIVGHPCQDCGGNTDRLSALENSGPKRNCPR